MKEMKPLILVLVVVVLGVAFFWAEYFFLQDAFERNQLTSYRNDQFNVLKIQSSLTSRENEQELDVDINKFLWYETKYNDINEISCSNDFDYTIRRNQIIDNTTDDKNDSLWISN